MGTASVIWLIGSGGVRIAAKMKTNGYKFSTLIEEIVRSDAFQKRNGRQKRGDT